MQWQCQIFNLLYHCTTKQLHDFLVCKYHASFLLSFFLFFSFLFFVCLFVFFWSFGAIPVAYGRSQARGCERELQRPAYTTAIATATWDLNLICNLHHSSQQPWILNLLSKARDWTHVLMDTAWVHYLWATMGTPSLLFLGFCFRYHQVLQKYYMSGSRLEVKLSHTSIYCL